MIYRKTNFEKEEDYETLKETIKQITVRNDVKNGKMHDVLISDLNINVSKAILYPRVRNFDNPASYQSQGTILANPNIF